MELLDVDAALERVRRDPDSTLAEVLRQAERLFSEHGYDGVTVRDVADAAGINVSTVHFHWKSKQALYEAVHRNLDLHLLHLMREINVTEAEGADLEGQIERWATISLEFMLSRPTAARLFVQNLSRRAPPHSPAFLEHGVAVSDLIETEIGRRLPEPREPREGPDILLLMLCPTYFGLLLFCDSSLQRELLGGSVYDSPEIQERVRKFGVSLMRRLLLPGSSGSGGSG